MTDAHERDDGHTPAFDTWLQVFFASYYKYRPVNATFIGEHRYDGLLPDFSANGEAGICSDIESSLQSAANLPDEPLSRMQQIDKRLAEGFLHIQKWEYASGRFHRGNPSLYAGEAIFGVMSLFLTDFAALSERVSAATERLNGIPQFLGQAEKNIQRAPPAWTNQAIAECNGSLKFLSNGALLAAGSKANGEYIKGVERATQAFEAFRQYLHDHLKNAASDHYGCGEEALSLHLSEAHFLDQNADDILHYAETQMAESLAYLDEHCADFAAPDRASVLDDLGNVHPTADGYYNRYQQIWDEVRNLSEARNLLTWPDFPIRYVPQSEWMRDAANELYFLFYRSPAAMHRPPIHDYLVNPLEDDLTAEQQSSFLRVNNDSVIRLNHVVHHGGIGHHVQNWHAFRSESRIGRIAAVDCASRMAMNCGGTMAEGWACYATDLIAENGGLTRREEYAEVHTRLRMCTRAIVDIRLHQQKLDFADAVTFYEKNAGMSNVAATSEVTRNSMYPGSAVMYLTGCDAIHELRDHMQKMLGDNFNLREFHERFLSFGSIPVSLIAEVMSEGHNAVGNRPAK